MGFIIGLFTLCMVLDCIVLVFLVLIQLPKKEAGAGVAFGGAATDALFGAGSGNVLTKITKYAATGFFVIALILGLLQGRYHSRGISKFQENLGRPANIPAPTALPPTSARPPAPTTPLGVGSNTLMSGPQVEATNAPAAPATTNR